MLNEIPNGHHRSLFKREVNFDHRGFRLAFRRLRNGASDRLANRISSKFFKIFGHFARETRISFSVPTSTEWAIPAVDTEQEAGRERQREIVCVYKG